MRNRRAKRLCKDCHIRHAQEMGRCRQCWRLRIEGKLAEPSAFCEGERGGCAECGHSSRLHHGLNRGACMAILGREPHDTVCRCEQFVRGNREQKENAA